MEAELKTLLEETLNEYGRINFSLCYVSKGTEVEIKIDDKSNQEFGPIYDKLEDWIRSDEFIDYLIKHNVYCNIRGFIELVQNEIYLNIELFGTEYQSIEVSEDFITNTLNVELNSLGIEENDDVCFNVSFVKLHNCPLEQIELTYFNDDWYSIQLNESQTSELISFLEIQIQNSFPFLSFHFECEIECDITCQDNYLGYDFQSSLIEIKLIDII